jgi:hypothetical protein
VSKREKVGSGRGEVGVIKSVKVCVKCRRDESLDVEVEVKQQPA